jgi:TetR/AcrR family transcriptional regulator, fatty acid metabolism regulator protein
MREHDVGAEKSPKKPGRAEREAERRKSILRAAVDVFSRKGYRGCRIADVAREAGVAYGLVYHYYKNKDELLETVFSSGWSGFVSRVQAAVGREVHLEARVRAVVQVAFEAYRRDPRGVKVLILEVGRSPAGGAVSRGSAFATVVELAVEMVRDAQRRGELSPELEPVLCATSLFGVIEMGLTSLVLGLIDPHDERAVDRARDQVIETILRGLTGARPSATEAPSTRSTPKSKQARRD